MRKPEYRGVELRAAQGVLEGRLIPYDTPARIGGVFTETFRPGSIRWDSVIANRQHDRGKPLARLGNGLVLEDSATELRAKITLPDTLDGRDVRVLVEAGVLRGLSAEFIAVRESWPGPDQRVIEEAQLTALAIVGDPGHESALIAEVRERMAAAKRPMRWWA